VRGWRCGATAKSGHVNLSSRADVVPRTELGFLGIVGGAKDVLALFIKMLSNKLESVLQLL